VCIYTCTYIICIHCKLSELHCTLRAACVCVYVIYGYIYLIYVCMYTCMYIVSTYCKLPELQSNLRAAGVYM